MKKAVLAMAVVFVLLGFSGTVLSADDKPEISDLVLKSEPIFKIRKYGDLILAFKSNQKPEDITLQLFGLIGTQTINKVYSSKDNQLRLEVAEKDGVYEINVIREIQGPPWPGSCSVTIWIKSGGKESNKLKLPQDIRFDM